jgi:cytochrome bd-type quinol oxidase subunit 2
VVANAYQGILPTWVYAFQFPKLRASVVKDVKIFDTIPAVLAVALILLCIVLAYSAWVWRITLAERAADAADAADAAAGLAPEAPGG